ncbi:fumarylacetoacetate hydrolase family protein [Verticiella sediminum]|uniref:Fumarylacetoacetate hydrolase family protein n=1 Tax=Verticiella sediminum TaxID=1247510 RepID=A0A556B184_9BURK|nr:fumarylacetoacetate hydrolase family protein [Verticiella sediminum]TSH98957.1 fumarylacetoacetate hydrolase family protein [Verticiella sediminum]
MKFLSYRIGGAPRIGVLYGGRIADLTDAAGCHDLGAALRRLGSERLCQLAAQSEPGPRLDEIEAFRPVVADPERIVCVGLNYDEHRVEANRATTAHPTVFLRLPSSQTGHGEPIVCPAEAPNGLDFEGEIAIVISRAGRRISEDQAWSHVFGYSAYNDASAREWQAHSTQWTAGKNFPATGAFGPVLATADEFDPDTPIPLVTRLNGKVMQHADTSMMLFSIPTLIAYISTFTELVPGDVIVSGTPGGVGFKRNPPVLMQDGDLVEVEVGGVGTLSNVVRREIA